MFSLHFVNSCFKHEYGLSHEDWGIVDETSQNFLTSKYAQQMMTFWWSDDDVHNGWWDLSKYHSSLIINTYSVGSPL